MPTVTLTPQQIVRKKEAGEAVFPNEQDQVYEHTISVLVENTQGALIRVVNMFSQRGFNLDSVTVGETDDATVSRMTLVTRGNTRVMKQVIRQLDRLLETLHVDDLSTGAFVQRELCLLKVAYDASRHAQIVDVANIFQARVVDITLVSITFEVTGPSDKIDAFVNLMRPHGIQEIARSGRVALRRAEQIAG